MSTHTLDRKLGAIFKSAPKAGGDAMEREALKDQFKSLLDKLRDVETAELLERAFTRINDASLGPQPPDTEEFLDVVGTLRNSGMVETSAVLFGICLDAGAVLDIGHMLRLAPNEASVEIWRKNNKLSTRDFQRHLLSDLGVVYDSAGGDWLLKHGDAKALFPLLRMFLQKQSRPKHLPNCNEAISHALARDTKGLLLAGVIQSAIDPAEFKTLAEVVVQTPVFQTVMEAVPRLANGKEVPVELGRFVKEMVGAALQAQGRKREYLSAGLARLATGILVSEKRGPQGDIVLGIVTSAGRQLRNETHASDAKDMTWVLEKLSQQDEKPSGKLQITDEGTRHIAIAFQKANEGFGTKEILALTARNLGLAPVGNKDDTAKFDPLRHEDTQGGLLPGDDVVIAEPGWMHGQTVAIRAKVRKKSV